MTTLGRAQSCTVNGSCRRRASERLLGDDDDGAACIRRRALHGSPASVPKILSFHCSSAVRHCRRRRPQSSFRPKTPWRAAKTMRGSLRLHVRALVASSVSTATSRDPSRGFEGSTRVSAHSASLDLDRTRLPNLAIFENDSSGRCLASHSVRVAHSMSERRGGI